MSFMEKNNIKNRAPESSYDAMTSVSLYIKFLYLILLRFTYSNLLFQKKLIVSVKGKIYLPSKKCYWVFAKDVISACFEIKAKFPLKSFFKENVQH